MSASRTFVLRLVAIGLAASVPALARGPRDTAESRRDATSAAPAAAAPVLARDGFGFVAEGDDAASPAGP